MAEHIEQFLRFSYGVIDDLWAAVQRRADAPVVADQADMISIHLDILQEAGQRYLEHMTSSAMPIHGRRRQDEETSVTGAAPLDQQSHAAEEDVQRPGCHGRVGEPPNTTTMVCQDTGSEVTTASGILPAAFPMTPPEIGATEHHQLQSTAPASQSHPLPSQFREGRRGCDAPYADVTTFSHCGEVDSFHHPTADCLGLPPHPTPFDWDTELNQIIELTMDELNSLLPFDAASIGRVDLSL